MLADRVLAHLVATREAVADRMPVPAAPEFRVEELEGAMTFAHSQVLCLKPSNVAFSETARLV